MTVIIDGSGHLMGRLATVVAKELLNGNEVVIVRAEDVQISGSLFRNKVRYWQFLRKTMATNPRRGPVHERAPSKILYRVIRGMVPHKTARGQSAMGKLKVFEGVPPMYNAQKKLVVPAALKVIRLKPNRKSCKLADLSNDVGWAHRDLMQKLKAKRDIKNAGWYAKKKEASKLMKESRVAANERLSSEDRALLLATGHL